MASASLVLPPSVSASRGEAQNVATLAPATIKSHNNGVSPPPAEYASLAYDDANSYAILFGGENTAGNAIATTWEFHAGNWTNLTPQLSVAPAPRWAASMAYDAVDREIVLFGGCSNLACSPSMNDTWAFSSGRWTDLTPTAGLAPPARAMAGLTFDGADGYLLLFGGTPSVGSSVPFSDTWSFVGGAWHQLHPNPTGITPGARCDELLAYDSATGFTLLFGGVGSTGPLGDTWSFQGGNWTELSPGQSTAPSPRRGMAGVFDAADGYVLLVGGYAQGAILSDSWAFESTGWVRIYPGGATLGPVFAPAAAYDSGDGWVLLFSGAASTSALYTGTLAFVNDSWTLLINPPGTQPDLFAAVGLVLLLPIILVIIQVAVVASQSYRFRRDIRGFDLPPGTQVQWLPPLKGGRGPGSIVFLPILLLFVFIFPLLTALGSADSGLALATFIVLGIPLLAVWAVLAYVSVRQATIRRVGLTREGVIFQRRRTELRIPWSNLQPSPMIMPQRRGWFFFHYTRPGRGASGAVAVPFDQARAIIASPLAPAWILSPLVVQTLGLPASRGLMPTQAPSAPSAPVPAPLGPDAPLSGGVAPPPPAPAAPPAVNPAAPSRFGYVVPPPPPPPPPPPVVGGPRARTGPQVQCPKCRGVFPQFTYVFCPTCGTRLA
ncbi:MAG TPA: kelch repeat-containing protein [Thermoplasmata archaeon]|nr:kelch repeat-containing protein [Thermoplasmata archaeon]